MPQSGVAICLTSSWSEYNNNYKQIWRNMLKNFESSVPFWLTNWGALLFHLQYCFFRVTSSHSASSWWLWHPSSICLLTTPTTTSFSRFPLHLNRVAHLTVSQPIIIGCDKSGDIRFNETIICAQSHKGIILGNNLLLSGILPENVF